jgi:hypothetical protein
MENKSLQFAIGEIQKQAVADYKAQLATQITELVSADNAGVVTAQTIAFKLENGSL